MLKQNNKVLGTRHSYDVVPNFELIWSEEIGKKTSNDCCRHVRFDANS